MCHRLIKHVSNQWRASINYIVHDDYVLGTVFTDKYTSFSSIQQTEPCHDVGIDSGAPNVVVGCAPADEVQYQELHDTIHKCHF